jgi:ribosome-associated protein
MTPKALAKKIATFAFEKKADDVALIDMRKVSDVTDFFLICSGDSDTQVKAIADAIEAGLAGKGLEPWHREGVTQRQWILLDFVDVVVHIFHRDMRRFYGLEKLWGDAKIERLADTAAPKPRATAKSGAAKTTAAAKSPASKTKRAPSRKKTAGAADAPPKKAASARRAGSGRKS